MVNPVARPSWRWVILVTGTAAQASTCSFIYGIPMLVPALRGSWHLSLLSASLVVSAPIVGLLLTLILWGAAADRWGERVVMSIGLALAAGFLLLTTVVSGPVGLCILLALAGAAGASINVASGRMVIGWFSVRERGLAMGTRQTAQPLGVAIAAVGLPPLAHHSSVHIALLLPFLLCAVSAVAVRGLTVDPPRSPRVPGAISPYRVGHRLWRVHAASAMLVVPQFAVASFTLVYLVGERHWDPLTAGRLIFVFQFVGALGRIGAGVWTDRVGSRLRPMRQLGVASAGLMIALAIGAWTGGWWIVVAFGVAAVVTVADNGMAYTAVAELAGSSWSGRALGIQNTGQNLASVFTAPVLAAVIGGGGYGLAFLVAAVCPLIAVPLTPVRGERMHQEMAARH